MWPSEECPFQSQQAVKMSKVSIIIVARLSPLSALPLALGPSQATSLVVPVYDAVSANRITFKQSQVVCVSHSTLCIFMAANAYGFLT